MLRVTCVVENTAGNSACWGEHGVAFWLETAAGRVLFDTGQSGDVLLHNAAQLRIPLATADALVLSHAHYDHTGGLAALLPLVRAGLPLYGNAALFQSRYAERGDALEPIGFRVAPASLPEKFDVRLSDAPQAVLPGVWTSGAIVERPTFEGRSAHHRALVDDRLIPDPYADDLSLVVETGEGLVVICGCCHAGLLNTLAHVRRHFDAPLRAVLGGTHLMRVTDDDLALAVETLRETYGSPALYPNHCTGQRAYLALANAFGSQVQPCNAGTVLTF